MVLNISWACKTLTESAPPFELTISIESFDESSTSCFCLLISGVCLKLLSLTSSWSLSSSSLIYYLTSPTILLTPLMVMVLFTERNEVVELAITYATGAVGAAYPDALPIFTMHWAVCWPENNSKSTATDLILDKFIFIFNGVVIYQWQEWLIYIII